MRGHLVLLSLVLACGAEAGPSLDPAVAERVSASVVKVRVVNETRRVATGSAVSLGDGVLITSCHGLRQARVIEVLASGLQPEVPGVVKDVEHDLCLLRTSADIPAIPFAQDGDALKVGDFVAAFGYKGPDIRHTEGTVRALHPYDGAHVIQTDAAFASGESGGALVDRDGRLVGILTFYAKEREDSFFAVPAIWVRKLLDRVAAGTPEGRQPERSFWERAGAEQPAFLQAAAREYAHDWEGLREVAAHWVGQQPGNAMAWIALGKALHHREQDAAAVSALEEAVKLDPRQPAAWYYLGAACRRIDRTDGLRRALERLDALSPETARALRDGMPFE